MGDLAHLPLSLARVLVLALGQTSFLENLGLWGIPHFRFFWAPRLAFLARLASWTCVSSCLPDSRFLVSRLPDLNFPVSDPLNQVS